MQRTQWAAHLIISAVVMLAGFGDDRCSSQLMVNWSTMQRDNRTLVLCGGLQSSGSSIISWCFLQRLDMDGVFDANSDMICTVPKGIGTPYIWYKFTITAFRLIEQMSCAQDEAYRVKPLLVVRDVRVVWASLANKPYGRNGTTAEDPPLRTRVRRFHEDWQNFHHYNWPMIQYEQFVQSPETTLRQTCQALSLPWDQGMISWPKPPERIANTHHGNTTFGASKKGGLLETLRPEKVDLIRHPIATADLEWLETEFAEFNRIHGYPPHRDIPSDSVDRLVPSFDVTRRLKWRLQQKPLRMLLYKLGFTSAANLPSTMRSRYGL